MKTLAGQEARLGGREFVSSMQPERGNSRRQQGARKSTTTSRLGLKEEENSSGSGEKSMGVCRITV